MKRIFSNAPKRTLFQYYSGSLHCNLLVSLMSIFIHSKQCLFFFIGWVFPNTLVIGLVRMVSAGLARVMNSLFPLKIVQVRTIVTIQGQFFSLLISLRLNSWSASFALPWKFSPCVAHRSPRSSPFCFIPTQLRHSYVLTNYIWRLLKPAISNNSPISFSKITSQRFECFEALWIFWQFFRTWNLTPLPFDARHFCSFKFITFKWSKEVTGTGGMNKIMSEIREILHHNAGHFLFLTRLV